MPEHVSLFHYVLFKLQFLRTDSVIDHSLAGKHLGYRSYEPVFTAIILMLVIIYLTTEVRALVRNTKDAIEPEEELTLRTFFEVFFEYFYNIAKDTMGKKNARRYFPIIGASAIFIFFSNVMGLIPGMLPPTSSLNVTAGCAIFIFLSFNYYGIKENGIEYIKHMMGWGTFDSVVASLALGIPLFLIEVISLCVRPVTLAIRLMLNMAVDHLLVSMFMGFFALLVPLPLMFLGIIVICVQTLVFCLLSSIYIGLATEHAEHH
ncbi:MAG: F0F1 ATP synthase subunit A [Myxococcota bacterium]